MIIKNEETYVRTVYALTEEVTVYSALQKRPAMFNTQNKDTDENSVLLRIFNNEKDDKCDRG